MGRLRKIPKLFAAARQADRRVSVWMRTNHTALVAELGTGRVAWRRVLPILEGLRLTDEVGQSLTRDTASRTWKRVCREIAAEQRAKASPSPRLMPRELAPGVRYVGPTPILQPAASARPVALRDAPRVAPAPPRPDAPAPAAPEATPEVAEATEQIRRVLMEMGALRVPLPSRTR